MEQMERWVWREARAMTRREVITKAIAGQISWAQAADIAGVSTRQMRRMRYSIERHGLSAVMDQRGGRPRRKRISAGTIALLVRLKRDIYADFSLRHFYEQVTEKHALKVSYNWLRLMLQEAGVVEREPGRGKYRRRRERRPLVGMVVHLDASTHEWIADLPKQDLVVALDDADGRILYARFFAQEGTASTFAAREGVLRRYGRFCELYTDRATHYRPVGQSDAQVEEAGGQVSQALRALGIRLIQARSPQARGRSERAFGTIQGRLPQELRLHGIADYARANRYLEEVFVPDFNRRFSVRPAQKESAFVKLAAIELELLLSSKHERLVRNDNTVTFHGLILQLPQTSYRTHFVRCAVTVHQLPDDRLGISYQGRLLARYDRAGQPLQPSSHKERAAAAPRWASKKMLAARPQRSCRHGSKICIFPPALLMRMRAWAEKCLLLNLLNPSLRRYNPVPKSLLAVLPKRTSLNVYAVDIFNCSRHAASVQAIACPKSPVPAREAE
jgi:transposase